MVGTDIAFMKPVNASSVYRNQKPELLTNGQSCTTEGIWPLASTENEEKPWFKVDLQGKFYIRTVTVTPVQCTLNFQTLNLISSIFI